MNTLSYNFLDCFGIEILEGVMFSIRGYLIEILTLRPEQRQVTYALYRVDQAEGSEA